MPTAFKDVMILSGSGVGGGSLVYAQTLRRPGTGFFDDWRKVCGDAPESEPTCKEPMSTT